jgi:hypothetical protein
MTATKDAPSTPAKLTSQQKTALTDETAKRIIDEEQLAREKKTERLRQMRLEQDEHPPVATPPAKRTKKK